LKTFTTTNHFKTIFILHIMLQLCKFKGNGGINFKACHLLCHKVKRQYHSDSSDEKKVSYEKRVKPSRTRALSSPE
jgi:hypothetical protein